MNPELPAPQLNNEQSPVRQEQGNEFGQNLQNPELAGERSPEREQNMQQVDRTPLPAPPPITPLPMHQPVPAQSTAQPDPDTTNPTLAADDDLIEKEWVDKAKKIILETKDDPYRRELEVNKLQTDYLRKRYGKELGVAD
jgi:hypothetical protein